MPKETLSDVLSVSRSDPIYNAHGYLTKVPVDAIIPYILSFTEPGELVVDPFAGSGMTAVAAKITGRNAYVSDLSVLGQHIAKGYLNEVDEEDLRGVFASVVTKAKEKISDFYVTRSEYTNQISEFVRTIWSFIYECGDCGQVINYYKALKNNAWKSGFLCPGCKEIFVKRNAKYKGDVPVLVTLQGSSGRQVNQEVSDFDFKNIKKAEQDGRLEKVPSKVIERDREMYRRSALKKWNLNETKQFFSARNAIALHELWGFICKVTDKDIKQKLKFAFTAILPRASKRYQWGPTRPLNAATQNYYIAPVYYEWNVFQLFERKVNAIIRSDAEIKNRQNIKDSYIHKYTIASADNLKHLQDCSVDYIFMDPPFGSNIFYSDMNLFHEAWLGAFTKNKKEAVIHTSGRKKNDSEQRYSELLMNACKEVYRVLKPGKAMSLVFGNSTGKIWAIAQKAIFESGFEKKPLHITILDKGQRSVKGLNSGRESVATLDLIITVKKPIKIQSRKGKKHNAICDVNEVVDAVLESININKFSTPSHVYLECLKMAMSNSLSLENLHLTDVLISLRNKGYEVESSSGQFVKTACV